ncbi:MAG: AsmA family protein [Alphaproteobacteria bacterium]|nr:AsmA family protein [Alphaproteobacteria bacterium]
MKKYIFLAFLVVVGAGGYYLYNNLEIIVRKIVNKYGSEITGTKVDLQGFKLNLTTGEGKIQKVTVANPSQYKKPYLFSLEEIYVKVNMKSLTKDTIIINEIRVDKPAVTYEMLSLTQNNIGEVLQNVKNNTAKTDKEVKETAEKTNKSEDGGKKIVVDKIAINGVTLEAEVTVPTLPNKEAQTIDKSIVLPNIIIRDIGKGNNGDSVVVAISKVMEKILSEASKAVVKNNLDDLKAVAEKNLNKVVDDVKGKVDTKGVFNKLKL